MAKIRRLVDETQADFAAGSPDYWGDTSVRPDAVAMTIPRMALSPLGVKWATWLDIINTRMIVVGARNADDTGWLPGHPYIPAELVSAINGVTNVGITVESSELPAVCYELNGHIWCWETHKVNLTMTAVVTDLAAGSCPVIVAEMTRVLHVFYRSADGSIKYRTRSDYATTPVSWGAEQTLVTGLTGDLYPEMAVLVPLEAL